MKDLIRESPAGQLLRFITRNKFLKYPEEYDDFELPEAYRTALNNEKSSRRNDSAISSPDSQSYLKESDADKESGSEPDRDSFSEDVEANTENDIAIARTESKPIVPHKTSDGIILVDWYTTDDPANPQNWSKAVRYWITFVICLYTFVVYNASAIYTPAVEQVVTYFGISIEAASLPLSLYVLAYGIGPLLFSPLSEIPRLGRSPVYAITFFLFFALSFPTAVVGNFGGLLVLRFLQGFFGSPALATGAASLQDVYPLIQVPYSLLAWVSAAYCGPALGPLISGFAVEAKGWRWALWEIVWDAAPTLLLMLFFLPETHAPTILLRRAERLRKRTGNQMLMSQSEIDQKHLTTKQIFWDALIKPMEITIKDPSIAFVNTYTAIVYGIYYSFFEVFPLVFPPFYGFTVGTVGVLFTCILVASIFGMITYGAYLYYYMNPLIMSKGMPVQESRLVPALIGCLGPPIGLFIFAWTARASIHWIVPTIGIVIYAGTGYVVMQCIFVYVPLSYPQYAASLFAANDFFRSAFAAGSIMFSRPMFLNLGIGKGVSLLGGLSVLGVIGIFILYIYGAKLRARSKFAVS